MRIVFPSQQLCSVAPISFVPRKWVFSSHAFCTETRGLPVVRSLPTRGSRATPAAGAAEPRGLRRPERGFSWSTQIPRYFTVWLWVKTNGIPFWGRCTTHFSLFEWGLGCSLGVRDFCPWPFHCLVLSSTLKTFWPKGECPLGDVLRAKIKKP